MGNTIPKILLKHRLLILGKEIRKSNESTSNGIIHSPKSGCLLECKKNSSKMKKHRLRKLGKTKAQLCGRNLRNSRAVQWSVG